MIKVNFEKAEEIKNISKHVAGAKSHIADLLAGKIDMTGWVDHPIKYDKEEFARIKEVAEEVKKEAEVLVSIGIGGSYLGAKAAIEYLSDYYCHHNAGARIARPYDDKAGASGNIVGASSASPGVEVIFVGNGLSEKYLKETLDYVEGKNFYINVISKSGGTLEPAVAFDKFKALCEKKYGKDGAKKRIIATTDKAKGILKKEADREGYRTFVVPDDIGGRYSVLSAVGLVPIACAGFDIDKLMKGAEAARSIYTVADENKNDAMKYAIIRNLYYEQGKDIEVLIGCPVCGKYFYQKPEVHWKGHGCTFCNMSAGESKIFNWLKDKGIESSYQYKYDDLRDTNQLSYDFFVEKYNLLIEFNGRQHYMYLEGYHKNLHSFHRQKHHDWLKRKYTRDNKINFLFIPFWEYENINEILNEYFSGFENFNEN